LSKNCKSKRRLPNSKRTSSTWKMTTTWPDVAWLKTDHKFKGNSSKFKRISKLNSQKNTNTSNAWTNLTSNWAILKSSAKASTSTKYQTKSLQTPTFSWKYQWRRQNSRKSANKDNRSSRPSKTTWYPKRKETKEWEKKYKTARKGWPRWATRSNSTSKKLVGTKKLWIYYQKLLMISLASHLSAVLQKSIHKLNSLHPDKYHFFF